MSNLFAVIVNNVPELEFDRKKSLTDQQLQFLDMMDRELSRQVVIGEQVIENPDRQEIAQFVAINLVNALKSGDDSVAAAMCSYLALRVQGLKKIEVTDQVDSNEPREAGGNVLIDLVFDEEYVKQVNVEFTPRQTTKH